MNDEIEKREDALIESLIDKLDMAARGYYGISDYGIPTHDENTMKIMKEEVRQFLNKIRNE